MLARGVPILSAYAQLRLNGHPRPSFSNWTRRQSLHTGRCSKGSMQVCLIMGPRNAQTLMGDPVALMVQWRADTSPWFARSIMRWFARRKGMRMVSATCLVVLGPSRRQRRIRSQSWRIRFCMGAILVPVGRLIFGYGHETQLRDTALIEQLAIAYCKVRNKEDNAPLPWVAPENRRAIRFIWQVSVTCHAEYALHSAPVSTQFPGRNARETS